MISRNGDVSNSILFSSVGSRSLALATVLCLGIVACLVAVAALGYRGAYAAGTDGEAASAAVCGSNYGAVPPANGIDDSGWSRNSTIVSPAAPIFPGNFDDMGFFPPVPPVPAREVYVWSACLTVGESADSTTTFLGYLSEPSPADGSLSPATFTHGDVEYTVGNLYYREGGEEGRQLLLQSDMPFPHELTLYLGNAEFPFSDSETFESGGNSLVWQLDEGLGWTDGQGVLVTLLETHGSPMDSGETPSTDSAIP